MERKLRRDGTVWLVRRESDGSGGGGNAARRVAEFFHPVAPFRRDSSCF